MSSTSRYDEIAGLYQEFSRNVPDHVVIAALLDLIGPVAENRLLDLACGNGRIARELARRGGRVTGLDLSGALLKMAQAEELADPLGVTYIHADCSTPGVLGGQVFDTVVCHFGLSDIDDLDGCLATVARLLRVDGAFVFSILHPCFPGWGRDVSASWPPGDGYYREGTWFAQGARSVLRQKVGATHRMLSTYLNSLTSHGLMLERVVEPGLPDGWADERPDDDLVPVYLIVRCTRS